MGRIDREEEEKDYKVREYPEPRGSGLIAKLFLTLMLVGIFIIGIIFLFLFYIFQAPAYGDGELGLVKSIIFFVVVSLIFIVIKSINSIWKKKSNDNK